MVDIKDNPFAFSKVTAGDAEQVARNAASAGVNVMADLVEAATAETNAALKTAEELSRAKDFKQFSDVILTHFAEQTNRFFGNAMSARERFGALCTVKSA